MSSSGSGFAWDCDPWTVVTVRIISHREGQAGSWVGSMVRMYVHSVSICVVHTIRFYACLCVWLVSVHNIWVCKYALYDREGRMAKRIQFSVGPPSGIVDITCP